jgi:hypothetical protein
LKNFSLLARSGRAVADCPDLSIPFSWIFSGL